MVKLTPPVNINDLWHYLQLHVLHVINTLLPCFTTLFQTRCTAITYWGAKLFKLAHLLVLFVSTMSSDSNQPLFRQIANFTEGGWELSYHYNSQDKGNQQDSLKWPKASKMQTKQLQAAPRQKKRKRVGSGFYSAELAVGPQRKISTSDNIPARH